MHVQCQSIFHPWFKEWFLANQGRLSPHLLYLTAPHYNFQQPIWKVQVSPDALWNHLWIWFLSAHDGIVVCWVSLFNNSGYFAGSFAWEKPAPVMVWKVKIIHYEKKIFPQYNSGKWSTEWLPKCESYPQRGKKLFKTPNQRKSSLCNSSNWLWQMPNFVAFSSDKASFGKKAGWNASYNRCDISVHWDHKRSSAKCKQYRSCSGNDKRRQYWCF